MPSRDPGDLDAALTALDALPPGDFVAGRNGLARELRAAGQADLAALVARLPKPTLSVWAANQLARTVPGEVARLLEAGAALRAAQRAALATAAAPAEIREQLASGRLAADLDPAGFGELAAAPAGVDQDAAVEEDAAL